MFIGDLLPAALAVCKPRRAALPVNTPISRSSAATSRVVWSNAATLPHGVLAIEQETQVALAAASEFAHSRCVDLQLAVEARLFAQAAAADYLTCLRQLLSSPIGRASRGVLVTAMRQANGVEIAVLDDGTGHAGLERDGSMRPAQEPAIPAGATLSIRRDPKYGTTILLRLPRPDRQPPASEPDEADGIAAFDDL